MKLIDKIFKLIKRGEGKQSKTIELLGKNNKIYIDEKEINIKNFYKKYRKQLFIKIDGNNNEIYLTGADFFQGLRINISGNNNLVSLKKPFWKHCNLNISMNLRRQNNRKVIIGENCCINSDVLIECYGDNANVTIGKETMIAGGVIIRTTDFHSVYDIKTNEKINPEKDIIIGEHVWIAGDIVSKGACIPDGCVIGAKSFVNKKFDEPNCLIAGTPARVIKRGVRWER